MKSESEPPIVSSYSITPRLSTFTSQRSFSPLEFSDLSPEASELEVVTRKVPPSLVFTELKTYQNRLH
jgi:hypothetical protein